MLTTASIQIQSNIDMKKQEIIEAMEEARRISRDPEVRGYTNMDELRKALEE